MQLVRALLLGLVLASLFAGSLAVVPQAQTDLAAKPDKRPESPDLSRASSTTSVWKSVEDFFDTLERGWRGLTKKSGNKPTQSVSPPIEIKPKQPEKDKGDSLSDDFQTQPVEDAPKKSQRRQGVSKAAEKNSRQTDPAVPPKTVAPSIEKQKEKDTAPPRSEVNQENTGGMTRIREDIVLIEIIPLPQLRPARPVSPSVSPSGTSTNLQRGHRGGRCRCCEDSQRMCPANRLLYPGGGGVNNLVATACMFSQLEDRHLFARSKVPQQVGSSSSANWMDDDPGVLGLSRRCSWALQRHTQANQCAQAIARRCHGSLASREEGLICMNKHAKALKSVCGRQLGRGGLPLGPRPDLPSWSHRRSHSLLMMLVGGVSLGMGAVLLVVAISFCGGCSKTNNSRTINSRAMPDHEIDESDEAFHESLLRGADYYPGPMSMHAREDNGLPQQHPPPPPPPYRSSGRLGEHTVQVTPPTRM